MQNRKLPKRGIFGIFFILIFWSLNWGLEGARTHILFFPQWLGYALTVDAIVYMRKGTSLFARSWKRYIGLFIISAPAWWLFELFNLRLQNWLYLGKDIFSSAQYALYATFSFSTVIPAVLGSAELAGTFKWIRRLGKGPRFEYKKNQVIGSFIAGWIMLVCLLIWPRYCFPLVWGSVYFILDPLNTWWNNRSLFQHVKQGDWRPVMALWTGSLICGFFWEFWNYYAYPKWVYQVPFVDFAHIFEMPLIGYLGYLPFSLELFALYHLVTRAVGQHDAGYIQLIRD